MEVTPEELTGSNSSIPAYSEPSLAYYSPSLITFLVTAIAILVLVLVILSIHLFQLKTKSNDTLPVDSHHYELYPLDKFTGTCFRSNGKTASSNTAVKQGDKIIGNVYEELAIMQPKERRDHQIEIYNHLQ